MLTKINPRVAVSSFLLSLGLVAAYAIVGILAGGISRIVYDLSLLVWLILFWAVIYVTGRHCAVLRATLKWLPQVSDDTKASGRRVYQLCARFEEGGLGKPAVIVGVLTYVVSFVYFLVFTLPRVEWRLSEVPYDRGFAVGIPLTSVPLLMTSELLHWALIRAVAMWMALVSAFLLYRISSDLPVRFTTLDHWEMRPLTNLVWSISYSLGVAGIFLLAWLPLLIVSVLGPGAINTTLAVVAAAIYGFFALGVCLWSVGLVKGMLASAKHEILAQIHDRLWEIYRSVEAKGEKEPLILSEKDLHELSLEVATLAKVGADIDKKKVFPLSAASILQLSFSPVVSSGFAILREYLKSVHLL